MKKIDAKEIEVIRVMDAICLLIDQGQQVAIGKIIQIAAFTEEPFLGPGHIPHTTIKLAGEMLRCKAVKQFTAQIELIQIGFCWEAKKVEIVIPDVAYWKIEDIQLSDSIKFEAKVTWLEAKLYPHRR